MKILILPVLVMLFISTSICGQEFMADSIDPASEEMLKGEIERIDLQSGQFGQQFISEYNAYEPDKSILDKLERGIFKQDIIIVLGTWCSDSQLQVPRFYKILDLINYDTRHIRLYAVDEEKNVDEPGFASLHIEYVPTFILYNDGKETGRIIESPTDTLEKDMLRLLND